MSEKAVKSAKKGTRVLLIYWCYKYYVHSFNFNETATVQNVKQLQLKKKIG